MKKLVESLNDLERRLTDLMASGLDNSGAELGDLRREAETWREIGLETLADEMVKASGAEGAGRFSRLFMLQRQIDWLRWRLSGPEVPDETWKRPVRKSGPLHCLPLSPVRHGDKRYILSLVYSREGNLVLLEPDGLEPYMLKTALKVKELQYLGEASLCEGVSFPIWRADAQPDPEEDASDFLHGKQDKHGFRRHVTHEEERLRFKYLELLHADSWWSYEPMIELPGFEDNRRLLRERISLRIYGCLFKTPEMMFRFLPLFVTLPGKAPGESPVLHVHDRIWTEEETAPFRRKKGK